KAPVKELDDEVLERFFDYEWPGNIRELENEVERLVVLAGDERRIGVDLLSGRIKERAQRANVKGIRVDKTLDEILEEVERRVLSKAAGGETCARRRPASSRSLLSPPRPPPAAAAPPATAPRRRPRPAATRCTTAATPTPRPAPRRTAAGRRARTCRPCRRRS